ncbi:MAG: PD40 domain-containing protein [Bacteroidetes bacterium]|nr:PD40 domain-containing protein [Bacteroidota bacterium]
MYKYTFITVLLTFITFVTNAQNNDTLIFKGEKHFKAIKQLTFGGDNAEAYFSPDGKSIVFQRTSIKDGIQCDQIFYGKLPNKKNKKFEYKMVSTGKGRTTCSYFMPDGKHIIYASTHEVDTNCPPPPDKNLTKKYLWPIYPSFDIYITDLNGKITKKLTETPGYDAEAVVSPKGDKIIFTSMRNGDLDLYIMDTSGKDVRQITYNLGYDGGAWFSPDGSKIVWRASRPKTPDEIEEYKNFLNMGLVAPTKMEIFVANVDGTEVKQITNLGNANWAPNFDYTGNRIIFASNHEYKRGFPFNLYIMNIDGTGLRKLSRDNGFDAFPMFTRDGKKLIFSSNRNNGGTKDTNLFIADWVE